MQSKAFDESKTIDSKQVHLTWRTENLIKLGIKFENHFVLKTFLKFQKLHEILKFSLDILMKTPRN